MSESLQLLRFLPFRLNRLAAEVSQHLSVVYRERFGIDIAEWRILATLGGGDTCTAQALAESSHMHKTRVSRAVANLAARGYLIRVGSPDDRRETLLRLSGRGRRLYRQLVPLALQREAQLLDGLSAVETKGLLKGLDRLEKALGLAQAPKGG